MPDDERGIPGCRRPRISVHGREEDRFGEAGVGRVGAGKIILYLLMSVPIAITSLF